MWPCHELVRLLNQTNVCNQDLLGYLETLLRATLTRCVISAASLTRVVEITSQLYRKAAASGQGNDVPLVNPNLLALLETITDGVHMRARVPGGTLAALFEVSLQVAIQAMLMRLIMPDYVKRHNGGL